MTQQTNIIDSFKVSINNKFKEEKIEITFCEVSGLCIEYEPVSYRDGMSFLTGSMTFPGKIKPIRLILKKGLTHEIRYLINWINERYKEWSGAALQKYNGRRRDVTITMTATKGKTEKDKLPEICWIALNALPVKIAVEPFQAGDDKVVIHSLELVVEKLTLLKE